jgi:hypothetical protein
MKMSYRQAWQMVSEINERSNSPIVEKKLVVKNEEVQSFSKQDYKQLKHFTIWKIK